MRLDIYLQTYYPDITRSQLQKMIKNGHATVNGGVESKAGFQLGEDDEVVLDLKYIDEEPAGQPDIKVLYEDSGCVVAEKPAGILTHSKGGFNPEATFASWLLERPGFEFANESERDGIVHRLDRATSGVIIAAKNEAALKHLQKQFQDRKAKKTYVALVDGTVEPPEAIIDLPIERNPKQPQRFRVGQGGKAAQTAYKVLQAGKNSLLELKPVTGRTHQLRVHLNYIKHPIIGDKFYDGKEAPRMFLHAHRLEITLPNKKRETFVSEVPPEFAENIS